MGRRREAFPRPDETQGLWGRDFAGRGYFSTANGWVSKDRETGEILLYPALAATEKYSLDISYDETTKEVVIRRVSE